MEPLQIYFIVVGLVFDMIGAIIIVTTIFTFKPIQTDKLSKIMITSLFSFQMETVSKYFKKSTENESKSFGLFLKELNDNLHYQKDTLENMSLINQELEKQKREYKEKCTLIGLSCLIGGFLLQAIGVGMQL